MKKILLVALINGAFQSYAGLPLLYKVHNKIFGSNNLKNEYSNLVKQAIKDHQDCSEKNIQIKQMNNTGSILALAPLSSFSTSYGFWFDEKYLDSISEDARLFQIYHESAHYIKNHYPKLVIKSTLSAATLISVLRYLHTNLFNYTDFPKTLTLSSNLLTIGAFYYWILPYFVKQHEKEADIEAAKTLSAVNKKHIVEAKIQELSKHHENEGIWWFSNKEQIKYLSKTLNNTIN